MRGVREVEDRVEHAMDSGVRAKGTTSTVT